MADGEFVAGSASLSGTLALNTLTYATALASLTRTPIWLFEMDLDVCTRTFGTTPCLATGTACYNTKKTCRYPAAYSARSATYQFTSADTPLPFSGPRPYIKTVTMNPTEIKAAGLTVNGRVGVEIYDEPDTDVGMDPYLSTRSGTVDGTFWRKLLARNPHYHGRPARLYRGFLGLAEGDFVQVWAGIIDNITIAAQTVKIDCVDVLKALDKISVPPKLNIKLVAAVNASATVLTLTDVTDLDATGAVRIGDEIITYTTRTTANNQLSGCTRAAYGTTADTHDANAKVQKVRLYAEANPFDTLEAMLSTDAGIAAGSIDSAAFADCKAFPGGELNVWSIVSEPTKLSTLYFELVDLMDCKSWVGEDLKITIRRNMQNRPGRTHTILTDAANVRINSASVDLNQKSRLSRVLLYWNKPTLTDLDAYEEYGRLDMAVDADAEGSGEYGEIAEKVVGCRWLHDDLGTEEELDAFVTTHTTRRVWMQRDPLPILKLDVELKDAGILTGDYVDLTTDEVQAITGADLSAVWEVTKRAEQGGTVTLTLLECKPNMIAYIAANDAPDHDDATATQRREYAYCCDDLGEVTGLPGYFLW